MNATIFIIYLQNYENLLMFVKTNKIYLVINFSILITFVVLAFTPKKSRNLTILLVTNMLFSFFLLTFPLLKFLRWVILESGE